MKIFKASFLVAICVLLTTQSLAEASRRGGYVRGYTRRDGTYVSGYYRGGSSGGSTYTPSRTFSSCADARAAGYSNMTVGSSGYSSGLDRDGDGIACESGSGGSSASPTSSSALSATSTVAAPRPGAARSGTAYFRAKDLETVGGVISKLPGTTYELAAFKHHVSVIPNSIVIINDGKQMRVPAPPVIYRGSLYIPAQFLYRFGCNLDFADQYTLVARCPNYQIFSSVNVVAW